MMVNLDSRPEGYQGKKNIYVCDQCHGHIVTVDRDAGTTPFTTDCCVTVSCKGWMKSSMYRVFDQDIAATHEWYKPSSVEAESMPQHVQHHIDQGGLLLRKIVNPADEKAALVDASIAKQLERSIAFNSRMVARLTALLPSESYLEIPNIHDDIRKIINDQDPE
jgi:hypothetical protein